VVLELDMGGLPPVLNRNYFAGVNCGGQIAR
jgi:hypothetical protein